jgi:hypothetical protein
MTARYREVFTGLGDPVIDISDEEDESDVSKTHYFSKEYFAHMTFRSCAAIHKLPDRGI